MASKPSPLSHDLYVPDLEPMTLKQSSYGRISDLEVEVAEVAPACFHGI